MRLRRFNTRPRDGRECIEKIFSEVEKPLIAIYNLEKNHLECAPLAGNPKDVERKFALDSCTISEIKSEVNGAPHVILAYDFCNCYVYIIDAVPELGAAAAVLTVLFAFLNDCDCCADKVMAQQKKDWCQESTQDKLNLPIEDTTICVHSGDDDNPLSGLRRLTPNFKLHY